MVDRGSYFDRFERQDVLDVRDLVPLEKPDFSKVVIYDVDGLRALLGDIEIEIIKFEDSCGQSMAA